jgi:hypothetical protein
MQITFKQLQDNCIHQGLIKQGHKWCGYHAHCWDDWKPYKVANCPILNPQKKHDVQLEGQMCITDILGEIT